MKKSHLSNLQRSDEQRSEKHKLKKERELEKEVMEAEREDDGGFSFKVKFEMYNNFKAKYPI